ncbi:unnamed protein product [Sphagnum balticum]
MEMPTMQEFFNGDYEPNWLRDSMPLERPRRFAQPYYTRPLAGYSQDVIRPLLRPQEVPVTVINHPNTVGSRSAVSTIPATLELRVPLCCEKCINKVKKALYQVEGVEDVVCDQPEQKVTITGNVNPETALRRVQRVKKYSIYWYSETSVDSATPATSIVHNKTHRNGYAPNYIAPSSYYTHNYYAHPLRRSDSSVQSPYYSRYSSAYPLRSYSPFQSSPYIDNSYDAYDPYNPMYSSRPYYMSNPYF